MAGRSGTAREAPAAVITVWGTGGAPGRTTLAVNLAAELAATGNRTLLIDADSYGACAGAVLGLLDESAGLATVCRLAGRGTLDDVGLRTASSGITETLSVLTGITQSSRWPELTRARLAAVFDTARACADVVVIDCAAPIEQDEELSYDTDAPQRNAATLTAIDAADLTLLVGTADPIGLGRLVRAYADAADGLDTDVVPVVNGLRTRVVGSPAKARVTDALARFAGIDSPTMLPYDRAACDDALLRGVTLREADRRGSAARAIAALAVDLAAWLSIPGSRGAEPGRRRPAQ
nr:ParA family protein [Spelaeicoccus albus]